MRNCSFTDALWRGNVEGESINLQMCWILGRRKDRKAIELIPDAHLTHGDNVRNLNVEREQ